MKKIIIVVVIMLLIWTVVFSIPREGEHTSVESTAADPNENYYNNNMDTAKEESLLPEDLNSILEDNPIVPLDTNPSSITVLVNRNHLLQPSFIPDSLVEPDIEFDFNYKHEKRKMQRVAAEAIEKMFAEARRENYKIYGISGYRSYERQKQIYDNNVRVRGLDATNSVSAKPGSSEHQTGLAMDVSVKSIGCRLDQAFAMTPEGKWLAHNCHRFGYIVRYPKGKNEETGYTYEPWHIRYVGTTVASYLYRNNLTLEEYYGSLSSEEYDGVDVEDADKVSYATPTPKPKESKSPEPTKKPKTTPKPDSKNKRGSEKNNRIDSKNPAADKKPKVTKKPEKPVRTPKPPKKPASATERPVRTPKPPKQPAMTPKPPTEKPEDDKSGSE